MTAVSRCVRGLKGIAAVAGLALSLAATVRAQVVAPEEFHVGDRIAITVEGPTTFGDTTTVRDGLIVRLPPQLGVGDIPLSGVKRADIQSYLTQAIGKYIKDPVVHATALVRISILGAVNRPGFYTVPSDMLLSDVVMTAGGPGGNADLNRTIVKRGGEEVLTRQQVASALSAGETLDQLQLAPGDQMIVGEQPSSSFNTILRVVSISVPVLSLMLYLSRRH